MFNRFKRLLDPWLGRRRPRFVPTLPIIASGRAPAPSVPVSEGKHGDRESPARSNGDGHQPGAAAPGNGEIVGEMVAHVAQLLDHQTHELAVVLNREVREGHSLAERRFQTLGQKLDERIGRQFHKLSQFQLEMIRRDVLPLADRISAAARHDAVEQWRVLRGEIVEGCSANTQRTAQRPIIEQLIALFDRLRDEAALLVASYRKDPDLSLHLGGRQLQERYDAAVRSFGVEIVMILRGLGVEVIEGAGGKFNPHLQKVVGVEMAPRPELDGQVARILRAGFSWNGVVLRPEQVIVFKKECKI